MALIYTLSIRLRDRTRAGNSHVSYFHFFGMTQFNFDQETVSPMAMAVVAATVVLVMQEGIRKRRIDE